MGLRWPPEHGAWGLFLVPMLCSAILADVWNFPLLLCVATAVALFLLRGSVEAHRIQSRGTAPLARLFLLPAHLALAVFALAGGLTLLFVYQRWLIAAVGLAGLLLYAVQLLLIARHNEESSEKRSLAAELVGVVLLSLAAPAAWIAARGSLDADGARVWLLNAAFFLGGVLYVKFRVRGLLAHRQFHSWRERLQFAWPVFLYHALLLGFLACLVVWRSLSAAVLISFLPGILRANGLFFQLGARFPIKRLGWTEIAHSLIFALLLIFALG